MINNNTSNIEKMSKETCISDELNEQKTNQAEVIQQTMTQEVSMHTDGLYVVYSFAVAPEDLLMLNNEIYMYILAIRYLRDKYKECSFEIIEDEYFHDEVIVTSAEQTYSWNERSLVKIDYSDADSLPVDFPSTIAPELVKHGGFMKLFVSRCPNYRKRLPDAPLYLEVKIQFDAHFNFMIGDKERFNFFKIRVMDDWPDLWRFCLIYDGRYIPATSFTTYEKIEVTLKAYRKVKLKVPPFVVDGVSFFTPSFRRMWYRLVSNPPFFNDILSIVK